MTGRDSQSGRDRKEVSNLRVPLEKKEMQIAMANSTHELTSRWLVKGTCVSLAY